MTDRPMEVYKDKLSDEDQIVLDGKASRHDEKSLAGEDLIRWMKEEERYSDKVRVLSFPIGKAFIRRENMLFREKEDCEMLYQKRVPCISCVAESAYRNKDRASKIETDGKNLYFVKAYYFTYLSKPYVLETSTLIKDDQPLFIEQKESIISAMEEVKEKRYKDPLTGRFNSRYFQEVYADKEIDALALIRIASYTELKAKIGVSATEEILKKASESISYCLRTGALMYFAENEFVAVFPTISKALLEERLTQVNLHLERIKDENLSSALKGSILALYKKENGSELYKRALEEAEEEKDIVGYKIK